MTDHIRKQNEPDRSMSNRYYYQEGEDIDMGLSECLCMNDVRDVSTVTRK